MAKLEDFYRYSWGHYLAGLIDGEGCFLIYGKERDRKDLKAVCRIELHADDKPLLTELQKVTGLGKVKDRRSPSVISKGGETVLWEIGTMEDCAALVTILRLYPLRGKKRFDFHIWAGFVDWWNQRERGSGWEKGMTYWNRLKELRQK